MSTTTELYAEILTNSGGDANNLPDNLKTTILKQIATNLGVDVSALPDNLETTMLRAIADNMGSGGGGSDIDTYFEGNMADIVLPNATKIKAYACNHDAVLNSLSLPKVTFIGNSAFVGCPNLTTVSMPNVVTLDAYAFNQCAKLNITSLPKSLESIGTYAFMSCRGTTSLTFNSKPTIASNAFSSCPTLTTINVPWAEGEVAGAPWGATNATINYNYTGG